MKFEAKKTGRPAIQALFGAGHGVGAKQWIFFSSAGYSQMAMTWANNMGIALYQFALDGGKQPLNRHGRSYNYRNHILEKPVLED